MGEVYRARDTKLGRDVAIKVLPDVFTSDPERLARFEREARMLAALNHPNIAAIYGFEDADGIRTLVLELVDGDTLADRIVRGPLPLKNALPMARQIVEALDVAHEKGIVHRDLKPRNVAVTHDGTVKVLDFGLAKATVGDAAAGDGSHAPTMTIGATRDGMPRHRLRHEPRAGARTGGRQAHDIWAFGCVLYEMLTRQVAFSGETVSDTIAAVLEREPKWAALPAATPPHIRRLLQRCLQKDPKLRLRDIADARTELDEELSGPERAGLGELSQTERLSGVPASRWMYAVSIGLLVLGTAIGWWAHSRPPVIERGAVRIDVSPPAGTTFVVGFGAISPDGQFLTFVAQSPSGPNL